MFSVFSCLLCSILWFSRVLTNSGFDPVKEPIIHRLPGLVMETFSLSALVVFLAEIGDKTQLLSLMLALRFRAPWLISLAILLATLLNHAIAVWFGSWVVAWISPIFFNI